MICAIRSLPRSCLEPAEELSSLRDQTPISRVVLYSGETAWLVTRYSEGHAVLVDDRFAIWFPGMPIDTVLDSEGGFLFVMNGPAHLGVRKKVGGVMGGATLQQVRRIAERVAAERVAKLVVAGQSADVVNEVAVPVAAACMSELLGVPPHLDRDLRRRACELAAVFAPPSSEQAATAEAALAEWVAEALDTDDTHPGDGLLSALLNGDPAPDRLNRDEVSAVLLTLLLGGLLPPARALAHGLLRLAGRPDLVTQMRAKPDLIPAVAEERWRLAVPRRRWRGPGSMSIPAGEIVAVSLGAVNRDPARFADPDKINPHRADSAHLSFAAGPH